MTRSRATSLAVKRGELRDGEEEHARGNGVAGAWADEALDSMRQLEAENLRLRFQVADLEGQVLFFFFLLCVWGSILWRCHAIPVRWTVYDRWCLIRSWSFC